MKLVVGIAAVLALASSPLCAKPRPALPDTPNMAEWQDVGQSMAELVEQGYSLVTAIATGDQDEVTVYFLSKGTELIRCRDGILLANNRGFVASCAKLVRPYQATQ
jgi:hypothetical protein